MKTAFRHDASLSQRSHGMRRRFHGRMVRRSGEPRDNFRPSGGNVYNARGHRTGAINHTWQNRAYWERNGLRDAPPAEWIRGWQ